jgi:predicted nuclease of predicted toxin-antitoxin system
MRILLDECMPQQLSRDLVGHEVSTVKQMGWTGLKNGLLLANAALRFDVILTVDRKLPVQQELSKFAIAVVVLRCASNDVNDLRKLVPVLLTALPKAKKGAATFVG